MIFESGSKIEVKDTATKLRGYVSGKVLAGIQIDFGADCSAKLAVGYKLDELINDITKSTPASFEPTIDYIVTKIPKFTFEKFPGATSELGSSMKSFGEVMSLGKSFLESIQ